MIAPEAEGRTLIWRTPQEHGKDYEVAILIEIDLPASRHYHWDALAALRGPHDRLQLCHRQYCHLEPLAALVVSEAEVCYGCLVLRYAGGLYTGDQDKN